MNIVVCVKAVPDPSIISLDPHTGRIDSNDFVYIVNPCDMVAVEEAVCIKERNGDSHVTLVSVGPPLTERMLRRGLVMGADEAILLWDRAFDNSDSYATALVLAKAIGSLPYDLIFCGSKAADTEAGQVGSIVAEMLNIPTVSRVVGIEVSPEHNKVTVESKLGGGNREKIEVVLPALLAVETTLNKPRYASLPSLMAGLRKSIKKFNLSDMGLSPEQVGLKGSKTRVVNLSVPKPRPRRLFTPDSSLSAAERIRLIMSGGVTQKQGDLLQGAPEYIASNIVRFLSERKLLPH